MIFDSQSLLSDDQAITAAAVSDVLDLGATGTPRGGTGPLARDLGKSRVPLAVQVTEDFAGLTSLEVRIEVSDDPAFGSAAVVLESGAVPLAELKAGYLFRLDWLPRGTDRRYLRLRYVVQGGVATAGRVTGGLVAGLQLNP